MKDQSNFFLYKTSVTTEKGLEEVPSNEEALRLLEERKRVHIPDETKRVIPSKKKEEKEKKKEREEKTEKEKERKRKREASPSNAKSAARKGSAKMIKTVVPITIRSAKQEVSTSKKITTPASGKDKEKVGESVVGSELPAKEVYRRRGEVLPFRHDTLFTELGHKGMITRFNRAAKNLISEVDVDYLESVSPRDRGFQLLR